MSTLHLTFFHDLVEGYTRNPGIPSTSECQEYTIVERLLQARMTKTIFLCFFKYDRKNSLRIFVKNPIRKDKKQILSLEEIFVLGKFHHFLEHTFQKQTCPFLPILISNAITIPSMPSLLFHRFCLSLFPERN